MKNKLTLFLSLSLVLSMAFFLYACKEEKLKTELVTISDDYSYSEPFDSIQKVINNGWRAINRSNLAGDENWQQGSYIADNIKGGPFYSNIAAHSSTASANEYALCPYTVGDGLSYINCWLITPALNMKNGDKFSFWTKTSSPVSYPDRMQVWMNVTNDGYNVGTGPDNTGDFTKMLLDINPGLSPTGYPTTWTKYEFSISGLPYPTYKKLRIGFRYYVQDGGPSGNNSNEIGIDDFEFVSVK
ncbi:MAG: hypothetical protein GC171_10950 [Terrimonas sp.]|nr:hypothetical protein [Terrimonas sp.]